MPVVDLGPAYIVLGTVGTAVAIFYTWGSINDLKRVVLGETTQTALVSLLRDPIATIKSPDGATTLYTLALYLSRIVALYGMFSFPKIINWGPEKDRLNRKKRILILIPWLMHNIEVWWWFARLVRGEDHANGMFVLFNALFFWAWMFTASDGQGNRLFFR